MRVALSALLFGAVAGASAPACAFGQTLDPDKARTWLEKTFGIESQRVVEATPDLLVTLRVIEPRPPSDFRVIVHLENFGPPDPLTPPSADEEYFVNCPSGRFHVDRIESFSEHGARGAQSTSFGPTVWGRAVPGSPEERIVSAVCDPVAPSAGVQSERPPEPAPAIKDQPPAALAASAAPDQAAAGKAKAPAPKPSAAPAGSARVQLFASPDRATAQRFVDSLPARLLASAAAGRRPEIVEASSGGREVYRVQITGFASAVEAGRFCAAAKAEGRDCLVFRPTGR